MKFYTKKEAEKILSERGYTVFDGEGRNGDYKRGSRLYYSSVNSLKNEFDMPLDKAELNMFPGMGLGSKCWHLTINYEEA